MPSTKKETIDDAAGPKTVRLEKIYKASLDVPIKGTAPLIVHNWSAKAKAMMLEAQTTGVRKKKEAKDPHADYMSSRYILDENNDGFPAVGFKAAMITAVSLFDGLTKVAARNIFAVRGDGPQQLVRIFGTPEPREDMVRVGMGTADIRYRACYNDWSAVLTIEFTPAAITEESILALVDAAGLGGIGDWRPSKASTGSYGTFEVAG